MKQFSLVLSSKGMTLIEVLIAVVILTFLSVFTFQTVQSSLRFKSKTQKDIDQKSTMTSALRIIERDISLAFHYRDLNYELLQEIESDKQKAQNPSGAPVPPPNNDPNNPNKSEPPKQVTYFMGEADSVYFTSTNNIRVQQDSPESDQMEVGYFLKNCSIDEVSSQCLFRSVATVLDDDVKKGGTETALISNVVEFKLKYLGEGKEEWVTVWRSDGASGDAVTAGHFPIAVEILLTTEINKKRETLAAMATIRFPNNPKPAKDEPGAQNAPAPGSIGGGNSGR